MDTRLAQSTAPLLPKHIKPQTTEHLCSKFRPKRRLEPPSIWSRSLPPNPSLKCFVEQEDIWGGFKVCEPARPLLVLGFSGILGGSETVARGFGKPFSARTCAPVQVSKEVSVGGRLTDTRGWATQKGTAFRVPVPSMAAGAVYQQPEEAQAGKASRTSRSGESRLLYDAQGTPPCRSACKRLQNYLLNSFRHGLLLPPQPCPPCKPKNSCRSGQQALAKGQQVGEYGWDLFT